MVRPSEKSLVNSLLHPQTENLQSDANDCFALTVLREESASAALDEFRKDALAGFAKHPKSISSKYFYDSAGSELFAQITDVEEYYPTRTEYGILQNNADQIVRAFCANNDSGHNQAFNLVELGAGDGRKTKVVLRALTEAGVPFEYMPIDISRRAMELLFASMSSEFGTTVRVHGFVGDSIDCLDFITTSWPTRRTVVLFLGSSIGNYSLEEGIAFLSSLRNALNRRDMLFAGFDLKKDAEVLRRAYSDSKGVTCAFNLNLLTRLNRELGANFDVNDFEHLALFNPVHGAMESYLISKKEQNISIAGEDFHFEEREPIHTEISRKYLLKDIEFMLRKAGFKTVANFSDEKRWFVDVLAEVKTH